MKNSINMNNDFVININSAPVKKRNTLLYEIMHMDNAIKNMIRENKNHQIANAIAAGSEAGMMTMDQSLFRLYKEGKITQETLLYNADNPEHINRRLGL